MRRGRIIKAPAKDSIRMILVILACSLFGLWIYSLSARVLENIVQESLIEIARQGAKNVGKEIEKRLSVLRTISRTRTISNPQITLEEKLLVLNNYTEEADVIRMSIADIDGNLRSTDSESFNISDRSHFKKALTGECAVGDPMTSILDGSLIIVFAAPVFHNGEIFAVLTATYPVEELCRIVEGVKFGTEGYAYMLDSTGVTIAHVDRGIVAAATNDIVNARSNPELVPLATLESRMIKGETGAGEYVYRGVRKYMGFTPVPGTSWSIAVTAPKHQVFEGATNLLRFILSLVFAASLMILIMNLYLRYLKRGLSSMDEELKTRYAELLESRNELARNRDELMRSEERYRLVFEAGNEGLWDLNAESGEFYGSSRFYELHAMPSEDPERFEFKAYLARIHPEDLPSVMRKLNAVRKGVVDSETQTYRVRVGGNGYRWMFGTAKALYDDDGRLKRLAGSVGDVTERKLQEEKIFRLAYYDLLTGLPNRAKFMQSLGEEPGATGVIWNAVLFIDIDNFKYVNDTFGHTFGNNVLKLIGDRFRERIGRDELVARLGGDEFAVLLKCRGNDPTDLSEAQRLAETLLEMFRRPFVIGSIEINLTASIGIASGPAGSGTSTTIIANADAAMYRAKSIGKNCCAVFTPSLGEEMAVKLNFTNHLRRAIERNEFHIVYQPQFDVDTKAVCGFEALLRWDSPSLGKVPPSRFIGIAEESGLIRPIGAWVLRKGCAFAHELNRRNGTRLCVSINVSPVQILHDDFVSTVKAALNETGVDPGLIGLEITETALMDTYDDSIRKLSTLRAMGIRIFLDDFGTGHSSLNYLWKLPISAIKIDRSFVSELTNDGRVRNLTETIIGLSNRLGIEIVAEGVETDEQLATLRDCGCRLIQGFLFSRPLPETEALKIVPAS